MNIEKPAMDPESAPVSEASGNLQPDPETNDGMIKQSDDGTVLQQESADDLLPENLEDDTFDLPVEDARSSIEAILFAAGDPVSLERIASVLGYDKEKTRKILSEMMKENKFDHRRGLQIRQLDEAYILSTKPAADPILKRLFLPRNRPPMTQAAYETLSIVAYNQPVTRSQVEAVRGVSCDSIIARLLEKNLIQECGSLDAPGRPTLFETSELFLKEFGLSSVRELPPMDMMMYGTLRDMETTLSYASGNRQDNQITIDQITEAIIPKPESGEASKEPAPMDTEGIMTFSSALFGEPEQ